MKKILLAAALLFSTAKLHTANANKTFYSHSPTKIITDTTFKVFAASKGGYGFDIVVDKKILIHQPFIPAAQGNTPFTKKTDAEKVAKLMIAKLKRNEMPPTISINELDSLHINH